MEEQETKVMNSYDAAVEWANKTFVVCNQWPLSVKISKKGAYQIVYPKSAAEYSVSWDKVSSGINDFIDGFEKGLKHAEETFKHAEATRSRLVRKRTATVKEKTA